MEKTKGYVTIPVYNLNRGIESLESEYLDYYNQTEEKYEGVLIDSSNYEIDLTSGMSLCEEFNQEEIIVNENYLSFNPVYLTSGEMITEDILKQECINALIPISKKNKVMYHIQGRFVKLWISKFGWIRKLGELLWRIKL